MDETVRFNVFSTEQVEVATGAQAVNRSSVAALAFLVYDIIITVQEEVDFIWPPWSLMKFNYFFVRYMPMLLQIPLLLVGSELTPHFHFTEHACFIWGVYQGVVSVSTTLAVDFILISRVYAFYFDSRTVRWITSLAFILEISVMCVALGFALPRISYDANCVVTNVPATLAIYIGAPILFQFLLFILTAYKFITSVRSGWGHIPIIRLLMRDGTWAFFLVFFVLLGQVFMYQLANHAFSGVLYGWVLVLYSFSGYRILLNIGYLTTPTMVSSNGFHFTSLFPETHAGLTDSYELSADAIASSSRLPHTNTTIPPGNPSAFVSDPVQSP
ncbi:hypothetical protein BT96DRAFT_374770 [Gymnopus androsaceus JB14]|uniref:DUF6533 domain-containing protein n=1 Tax=Gymnopus androsaceus JB14 TaxID=1447944 RepID=A0A6A4IKE8_9AGAR|nr:hypothetical protein BT96DRAFT_374770 [Gymnopus androsaceus JB14]